MSGLARWAIGAGERAAKTFGQVLGTALVTGGLAFNWHQAWHLVDVALLAAAISLITSVATVKLSRGLTGWQNTALRAGLTFGQSALAFLSANTFLDLTSVPWLHVFQISLVAAFTSVVTSIASWGVGPLKNQPSLTPTA